MIDFGRSTHRLPRRHSLEDELAGSTARGPVAQRSSSASAPRRQEFDFVLLFSVRYYHGVHGARRSTTPRAPRADGGARGRARSDVFPPVFRGVRAIMYNSFEERATMHGRCRQRARAWRRRRHRLGDSRTRSIPTRAADIRLHNPFIVYVGRIDANKGCAELFGTFTRT